MVSKRVLRNANGRSWRGTRFAGKGETYKRVKQMSASSTIESDRVYLYFGILGLAWSNLSRFLSLLEEIRLGFGSA